MLSHKIGKTRPLLPNTNLIILFQEKNSSLELQISSLAIYHLSYPGSIDGTGLNIPLENNGMQHVVVCDTICYYLTDKTNFILFISMF